MKWFQHDSDASNDAKIKRLIIRHGAEGYAVYFHCLELIAGNISKNNITFELEHDAEIIADNLKIKGTSNESAIDKVNRIMLYIIELGLFHSNNNRIFCYKMAQRLDNTISRSPEINSIKNNVFTTKLLRSNNVADKIRIDKIRTDKIKLDKKNKEKKIEFSYLWKIYPKKLGKEKAFDHYKAQCDNADDMRNAILNYCKYIEINNISDKYIKHGSTFFNKNWKDFINYNPAVKPKKKWEFDK